MPNTPPRIELAPGLDQFTIDLTDRARKGEIDPVLGRDNEIRQGIDILEEGEDGLVQRFTVMIRPLSGLQAVAAAFAARAQAAGSG